MSPNDTLSALCPKALFLSGACVVSAIFRHSPTPPTLVKVVPMFRFSSVKPLTVNSASSWDWGPPTPAAACHGLPYQPYLVRK